MKIGDEELLDGKKRGYIRGIKDGRYGVCKRDSCTTHYYDAERLTALSDDPFAPAAPEGFKVGDVGDLVAPKDPMPARRIDAKSRRAVDGAPILKWRDLDTLQRIDEPDAAADHNRDTAPVTDERQPAQPAPAAAAVQPDPAALAADPAPPVAVFSAPPPIAANRVEVIGQATCSMCGKPLKKRHGAKTCSDTCRKRYSRRKDDVRKSYRGAKNAIDALLKYASHDDLRDLLSVYVGALNNQISAAKLHLVDLNAVPTANRTTAPVTDR